MTAGRGNVPTAAVEERARSELRLTANALAESWEEIKAAGKWKFVLTQYLLFRGGVLFALVVLPALTTLQFHGTIIAIMALSAGVLGAILVFFGRDFFLSLQGLLGYLQQLLQEHNLLR